MARHVDREHILSEIKRLAERDGVTPGKRRFESDTGIRETEIYYHWPDGWNSAVREAGLTPNTRTVGYTEDALLELLADLSLTLGRIPNSSHIRQAARQREGGFPSDKTFGTKLGPKRQQVARLRDYCLQRTEHAGAVPICESWLEENAPTQDEGTSQGLDEGQHRTGFVYLMKSGRYHKIGLSVDPVQRGAQLATGSSGPIQVVHCIKTDDMHGIERYWHRRFAAKRVHGEWFELTVAEVKAFRRRKSFM